VTVLFEDDFTLAPAGALGTVHNPQTFPTDFGVWTDPFSDPLETLLAVGATYDDSPFHTSVQSLINGGATTPYTLPGGGFELRANIVGPTGNDNRLLFIDLFFHTTVFAQNRAKIEIRWQGNVSTNAFRLQYGPQNVVSFTSVNFNGPAFTLGVGTPLALRVRVTPTVIDIYNGATLLKSQAGTFTFITDLHEVNVLLSALTTAPMTSYIISDLRITTLDHVDGTVTDLEIDDALHAHTADSSNATPIPDFPAAYPCASRIDGFAMAHTASLIRTPFEAGNARQRRSNFQMPTQVQLAWKLDNEQFHPVFTWLNNYGYDWFFLRLSGIQSSELGVFATKVPIRLLSDLTQSLIRVYRQNWWLLSCTAEIMPPPLPPFE